MDFTTVFDYAIPTLHPMAVHLPLVAIPAAAVAAVGYAAVDGAPWRYAALGLSAVGAAGALFATRTGESLHHELRGEPMVDLLIEAHEETGEWALYATAAAAVLLAVLAWRARRGRTGTDTPRAPRIVAAVLLIAAAVLVLYTGHVGSTMVWGVPAG